MDHRRLVIAPAIVIALAAVGAALVGTRSHAPPRRAPPVARTPSPRVARPVAAPERAVLPASLGELSARLDARYVLRPDARFALALQHLASLEAPGAPAPELRPSREGWSVLVRGAPVATLARDVTFDAMLTAAVAFATERDLPTRVALVAEAPPRSDALTVAMLRDPWGAARAADARWVAGAHRSSDLAALARSLSLTAALSRDPLGYGDAVTARALAALALARAAGSPDPAAEALLCHAMTYTAEATGRAEALAPTHRAVAAWVRGGVADLATRGDSTARLMLAARGAEAPPRTDLAGARAAAQDIPGQVLTSLERDEGAMSGSGAAAFARFSALESAEVASGGWIDQAVTESHRRSRWGDGLMRVLAAAQQAASTPAQAQEVLALLGNPSDPMGEAWLSWARRYIVASASASARATLAQDVGVAAGLGVPASLRSLRVLIAEGGGGTSAVRAAIERLVRQMDQRPAHRLSLGTLLIDGVYDVPRAEAMLASGVAQGPGVDPVASARLSVIRGDRAGLLALAATGSPEGRVAALRPLARTPGADAAQQDAAWQALVDESGGDGELVAQWASALMARGEAARARETLERWASSHGRASTAARVAVAAALGEALLRLRDLPGAWRVLEPWATSDSVAALSAGARALIELERFEEAERLARRAWDRDEHAPTAALLAEACWRRSNHAAAAEALSSRVAAMSEPTWEETVGQSFDAVFSGRSPTEGKAALDALGPEVDVLRRSALLRAMLRAGHGGIAAQIHESLRAEGDAHLELLLARYAMRVASEGELPAGEWLQGEVPAPERAQLADAAYARRLDEVLWGVVELPPGGAAGDRVWLLRAASSLREGPSDPHRPELLEHLRASDNGTWAHTLARHLLDLSPMEAVRALADTREQEWQTAYYLGLKALAAGERAAASDWFHGALDPGEGAPPEARWAIAALREEASGDRGLAQRVEAE